jgi:hypothetical protein
LKSVRLLISCDTGNKNCLFFPVQKFFIKVSAFGTVHAFIAYLASYPVRFIFLPRLIAIQQIPKAGFQPFSSAPSMLESAFFIFKPQLERLL